MIRLSNRRIINRGDGDGECARFSSVGCVGNNRNFTIPVICWLKCVTAIRIKRQLTLL
ncbi:Uncharacterised protein [Vibrio cholerae]|nr:Uncharacterised protein [Vibrio cholerae]CSB24430.1 Uncharacterised protein [Vibrio cholerae]CSB25286.1 Uncharacterised protein [Vibrio cholerae]CSC63371.1 Uncharacterised protein [Vibrio cholerae]CSC93866.1 Uncharacterised protein [Vibrio cholerae]